MQKELKIASFDPILIPTEPKIIETCKKLYSVWRLRESKSSLLSENIGLYFVYNSDFNKNKKVLGL